MDFNYQNPMQNYNQNPMQRQGQAQSQPQPTRQRKNENFTESSVKQIIKKLSDAVFTTDNAPELINEIKTTDLSISAQVESLRYQMVEFQNQMEKDIESYEASDTTKTHVTRDLYAKEFQMTEYYRQLFSWVGLQYELMRNGLMKSERVLSKIESLKIESKAMDLRKEHDDRTIDSFTQSTKYIVAMSMSSNRALVQMMQKNQETVINSLLRMSFEQSQMMLDILSEIKLNGTLSQESIRDFTNKNKEVRNQVAETLKSVNNPKSFDIEMQGYEKQIDKMATPLPKRQPMPTRQSNDDLGSDLQQQPVQSEDTFEENPLESDE